MQGARTHDFLDLQFVRGAAVRAVRGITLFLAVAATVALAASAAKADPVATQTVNTVVAPAPTQDDAEGQAMPAAASAMPFAFLAENELPAGAGALASDATDADVWEPPAAPAEDESPADPTASLPSASAPILVQAPLAPLPITGAHMPDGGATVQPPGFISFCTRFGDQCRTAPGQLASIPLTDATLRTLLSLNTRLNHDIWPQEDLKHFGRAEYWTIATDGYGDCEDSALTKRKELVAMGFPMPALRIAVVMTAKLQRHAVLTVVTDQGDLVLDNLTNAVKPWDQTGYRWLERQSATDPYDWVWIPRLRPADQQLAAAPPP